MEDDDDAFDDDYAYSFVAAAACTINVQRET